MRSLILGGDGYCGWPTALRLSARGMDVSIVDNLSRRRIDRDLGSDSLVAIQDLEGRVAAWNEASGKRITLHNVDVAEDFGALVDLLATFQPDSVVHMAEQRAVPYSMMSSAAGQYTIRNNLMATTNLLAAMVEAKVDAHLVHIGSVGVYGYETLDYEIPEGYLNIRRVLADGSLAPEEKILHPFNPVSHYHLTKALDHLAIAYYAAKFGVRASDLHQGTVWGAETLETLVDPRLANRFDYDTIYGTVINRFAVQAALGKPISVYGTGNQTRGFIHIDDVLNCVEAVLASPPTEDGRVRVVNQVAQTMRISDLADLFARTGNCEIVRLPSPRAEPPGNDMTVDNISVHNFGVSPIQISEETVRNLINYVGRHVDAANPDLIYPNN
ncbi:MAG: NAD-dependent epimerase/dehydratase family protein [Hyphomonas sp.]|nr:NAD-dependent epimerase/dehydratase family protein [Hyphomonas sp.]